MQLSVNGESETFDVKSLNLEELLDDLGHAQQRVAIEKNGCIIKRNNYASESLNDGDRIEIITLVGGG